MATPKKMYHLTLLIESAYQNTFWVWIAHPDLENAIYQEQGIDEIWRSEKVEGKFRITVSPIYDAKEVYADLTKHLKERAGKLRAKEQHMSKLVDDALDD